MISWSTIHESGASLARSHSGSEGSSGSAGPEVASIVTEEAALHSYEAGYEDAIRKSVVEATRLEALELFRGIIAHMDASPFKSADIYFLCICNAARTLEALGRSQEAYAEILRAVEMRPGDFHAVFKAASLALDVGDTWTCRRLLLSDVAQRQALQSVLALMIAKCERIDRTAPIKIPRPVLPVASTTLRIGARADDFSFMSHLHDPELWSRPFVTVREVEGGASKGVSATSSSDMDVAMDEAINADTVIQSSVAAPVPPQPASGCSSGSSSSSSSSASKDVIDLTERSGDLPLSEEEAHSTMITISGEECAVSQSDPTAATSEAAATATTTAAAVEPSAPSASASGASSSSSSSSSRRSTRRTAGTSSQDEAAGSGESRSELVESVQAVLTQLYPSITDQVLHSGSPIAKPLILHQRWMYDRAREILTRSAQSPSSVPDTATSSGDGSATRPDESALLQASEGIVVKLNTLMTSFRENILAYSGRVVPTGKLALTFMTFAAEAARCVLQAVWAECYAAIVDRVPGLDSLIEAIRKNAVLLAFVARVSHARSSMQGGGLSGLCALEDVLYNMSDAEALLVLECCGDWLRARHDGRRTESLSDDSGIGRMDAVSFSDFARRASIFALNKLHLSEPQDMSADTELTRVRRDWAKFIFDMNTLSHQEKQSQRPSTTAVAASEFLVSLLQRTSKQMSFPYLRSIANLLCEASIGLAGNAQPVKEMLKDYGKLTAQFNRADAATWISRAVDVLEESFDLSAFVGALRAAIANDFECMNQSILGNDSALVVLFMRILEVLALIDQDGQTDAGSAPLPVPLLRARLVRLAAEAVKFHCRLNIAGESESGSAGSGFSTDATVHFDWIEVLMSKISSKISCDSEALSESAIAAQLSWKNSDSGPAVSGGASPQPTAMLQSVIALIHVISCTRASSGVASNGSDTKKIESIVGHCLRLIGTNLCVDVAQKGRLDRMEYEALYRPIAEHLLSVCLTSTFEMVGSTENSSASKEYYAESVSFIATALLLHRPPDANTAFLPEFVGHMAFDSEELQSLGSAGKEIIMKKSIHLLWLTRLISELEKNSASVSASVYLMLVEALLVLRHDYSLAVVVKENLDAALLLAFEAIRSKAPKLSTNQQLIEVVDIYAINSLMPIFYSLGVDSGCGAIQRYGNEVRSLMRPDAIANRVDSGASDHSDEESYDPETIEKLVLFMGRVLSDRFGLTVAETTTAAPAAVETGGNKVFRAIPNELAFDIYAFLTFAKGELALVSRTSWKTCLTALYNTESLRSHPPSVISATLSSFLFEDREEDVGDGLMSARTAIAHIDDEQRVVRDRIEAVTDALPGDGFAELRSTFYYECLVAGVGVYAEPGEQKSAEDVCVPFIESREENTGDVLQAQGSSDDTIVIDLREHCEVLTSTQRRICPTMELAWKDLCCNNDVRDSTDTLERILIGLYELASASMEELSKLCFPPGLLASSYAAAKVLCWPGQSTSGMEGIVNVLHAVRVRKCRIPSLESRNEVSNSSAISGEANICCVGCSDLLTCRAVESMFNKHSITSMEVEENQDSDYSIFELLSIFLCRYHKTVCTFFHRAADLMIAAKFASPNLLFSEVPVQCDALYLEEFVKHASAGTLYNEALPLGADIAGGMAVGEKRALVSVAELRVLLEHSLSVLFHEEDQVSAKQACFHKTLRHCVQGFVFAIQLDTLSYFLPTFAADLVFRLGLGLQSLHYFLHQADAAFKALSLEKKLRIHVLHVYHNARLQTSLKWLFTCYDYVNSAGGGSASFDILALTDDLSILDTFKVSSLEAPPGSIVSTTTPSSNPTASHTHASSAGSLTGSMTGFGVATITSGSVGTIVPSPIVLTSEITSSMQLGSPGPTSPPGSSAKRAVSPSLVRAISHLWSTILEALAGLRLCRKLDVWDAKSIYSMSKAVIELCDHRSVLVPDCVRASLQLAEITLSVTCAADLMWRLFEKRRPQVVALWKTEKGTGSRFDQIFQSDFKYDLSRKKYFMFMLKLLQREAATQVVPRRRLVELASASLATKERSAVVAAMARCAVSALLRAAACDLPVAGVVGAGSGAPSAEIAPVNNSLGETAALSEAGTSAAAAVAVAQQESPSPQALPALLGVSYQDFHQLTQLAVTKRASHDIVCIHKTRDLALLLARCISRDLEQNINSATSASTLADTVSMDVTGTETNNTTPDASTRSAVDPESLDYPNLLKYVAELMNRFAPAATASATSAGVKRSRQSAGKRQTKAAAAPVAPTDTAALPMEPEVQLNSSVDDQAVAEQSSGIPVALETPADNDISVSVVAHEAFASAGDEPQEEAHDADEVDGPPMKRAHIV